MDKKQHHYMFLDIETSGLPKTIGYNNYHSYKLKKHYDSSRIVQISWIITDENGNRIKVRNYTVKPNGFTIPKEVVRIHGITTEYATQKGINIKVVFNKLMKDLTHVKEVFAHNMLFDANILFSEVYRNKRNDFTKYSTRIKYIYVLENQQRN